MASNSLDMTRKRFLDAGLDELRERGLRIGVEHIRLADVAERVGLTPAAAYKVWGGKDNAGEGGQGRFRRDLARHAVENLSRGATTTASTASIALMEAGNSLHELTRVASKLDFDEMVAEEATPAVLLGLYAAASRADGLRDSAQRAYDEMSDASEAVFGQVLEHYELRVKPPLTLHDLAVALHAVIDGFVVHHGFEPEVATKSVVTSLRDDEPEREWTLFAFVVATTVDAFTEPITPKKQPKKTPPRKRA